MCLFCAATQREVSSSQCGAFVWSIAFCFLLHVYKFFPPIRVTVQPASDEIGHRNGNKNDGNGAAKAQTTAPVSCQQNMRNCTPNVCDRRCLPSVKCSPRTMLTDSENRSGKSLKPKRGLVDLHADTRVRNQMSPPVTQPNIW